LTIYIENKVVHATSWLKLQYDYFIIILKNDFDKLIKEINKYGYLS